MDRLTRNALNRIAMELGSRNGRKGRKSVFSPQDSNDLGDYISDAQGLSKKKQVKLLVYILKNDGVYKGALHKLIERVLEDSDPDIVDDGLRAINRKKMSGAERRRRFPPQKGRMG